MMKKKIGRIVGAQKGCAVMKVWMLLLTKLKLNAGKIAEDVRVDLLLKKKK